MGVNWLPTVLTVFSLIDLIGAKLKIDSLQTWQLSFYLMIRSSKHREW